MRQDCSLLSTVVVAKAAASLCLLLAPRAAAERGGAARRCVFCSNICRGSVQIRLFATAASLITLWISAATQQNEMEKWFAALIGVWESESESSRRSARRFLSNDLQRRERICNVNEPGRREINWEDFHNWPANRREQAENFVITFWMRPSAPGQRAEGPAHGNESDLSLSNQRGWIEWRGRPLGSRSYIIWVNLGVHLPLRYARHSEWK